MVLTLCDDGKYRWCDANLVKEILFNDSSHPPIVLHDGDSVVFTIGHPIS